MKIEENDYTVKKYDINNDQFLLVFFRMKYLYDL
jgi:hypothetical protein